MKPEDLAAAGVFELVSLSEVDEDAPPEAAGEDEPPRKSSKSSLFACLLMSMAKSRFFNGIERPEEDDEDEVGEGG